MRFILTFIALGLSATSAVATTDKFRLIWNTTPETAITVAWCQKDGDAAKVRYHEIGSPEPTKTHGIDHETSHLQLESRFARLTGLKPGTTYEFLIEDSNSKSPRFTFTTASAGEESFSFVAGGDSRNHREARQRANRTVAILNPLFVCFGGDMIARPTPESWAQWLDDWQLTTTKDGRMIPIIAARGNHEGAMDIHSLFDTPIPEDYYALDFGNGFLRVYTLNSNIVRAGKQGAWLAKDLAAKKSTKWKIAQYHHPFRPHQSAKTEQHAQYNAWAPLFFEHGMDLAIECDSHVVKRTWPVRPSTEPGSMQGLIRDDAFGTTFIGEGCWGAPLRRNDDDKTWTRASGSFNQLSWIWVTPEKIFSRTVKVDSVDSAGETRSVDSFELPDGLEIWEPESGAVVTILPRGTDGRPSLEGMLARVKIVAEHPKFADRTTVRIVIDGDGESGTTVRYTLDGSAPKNTSALYEGPFEITATTTVRAAIFRNSKAVTNAATATYTRG